MAEEKRKMLFLSSGIGITPFLCIARCLAAAHAVGKAMCNCDVVMMHSTRGLGAVPYIEELRSIAKESSRHQGAPCNDLRRCIFHNRNAKSARRGWRSRESHPNGSIRFLGSV